jgi:RNA polymerase sigma factor (sigma-70 family)
MTGQPDDPAHDLALVRAVLRHEEVAVDEFADRLRSVARIAQAQNAKMGHPLDSHDLADVVQDTIVVILKKLDLFVGTGPLDGWIFRVCCLEFLNGVRRRRRRLGRVDLAETPLPDPATASERERMVEREQLYKALDRVGGVEAEAVRMKHFDGLTFDQIGGRLGLSPNTIKTRYYRGLARLETALLGERGEELSA